LKIKRCACKKLKVVSVGLLLLAVAVSTVVSGCGGGQSKPEAELGSIFKKISAGLSNSSMITIAAGGDVNFGDGVTPTLTSQGLDYPFENVGGIFKNADLSFVNLECCISSGGAPVGGKEFCFRGPADSAAALSVGGIKLARLAIDSGADLVIGHHPHVVQGFELYKNRLIAYSLGNYVFSPPREISSKTLTVVALLGPNGLIQAKLVPTVISGCRPAIMSGGSAAGWLGTVAGYCSGLDTNVNIVGERGFINGATASK